MSTEIYMELNQWYGRGFQLQGRTRAREALRHYCEYIAAHGFKGGATKALAELDSLDKDAAVEWIRKTYARHVHDDAALIQFVMGQL